jgi:hypothetical protein
LAKSKYAYKLELQVSDDFFAGSPNIVTVLTIEEELHEGINTYAIDMTTITTPF